MYRIEALLSARLFLSPQIVGDRIYFVSDLSGRLSLYAMDSGGSIPEPLLPREIALQNPHHVARLFQVFPKLDRIVVMLDEDGNEDYKPVLIPMAGGYPEPIFADELDGHRAFLGPCYPNSNLAYLTASSHAASINRVYRANLEHRTLELLAESTYGRFVDGVSDDHGKVVLIEGYTAGDHVLFLHENGHERLLHGTPMAARDADFRPVLGSLAATHFVPGRDGQPDGGLIAYTTLFDDAGGLGYLDLSDSTEVQPVPIAGVVHDGDGEFLGLEHLGGDRFLARYNIDGCDWVYEGRLDDSSRRFQLEDVLVGQGELANGVLEHMHCEPDDAEQALPLSFSTATSPTQIYTLEGSPTRRLTQHTRERLLGIPDGLLSPGEDASFTSHDGLRVSARLYLPPEALGVQGPRPLVYYIHGGPQSQERPDFTWFSMPLIQFLTLNGMAVFVPNARGSSGYGLDYMKRVDHDWGGQDRLDHVYAMTEVLREDPRLDVDPRRRHRPLLRRLHDPDPGRPPSRAMGSGLRHVRALRSVHVHRAPARDLEALLLSDRRPPREGPRSFLTDRSPRTYIDHITAPLLVIQGQNDPRVIEQESRDLVEHLQGLGKTVDYLVFGDEGHDVLKFENKVACYNAMTEFFKRHLDV